jgi:hypothetical protein
MAAAESSTSQRGDDLRVSEKILCEDVTAVVFCTGYERRMRRGHSTFGRDFDWNGDIFDPTCPRGFVPLTAGGRIISPEEIDTRWCPILDISEEDGRGRPPFTDDLDVYDSNNPVPEPWDKHDCSYPSDTAPASLDDLFGSPRFAGSPSGTLRSNPIADRHLRDSLMAARVEMAREIRSICERGGAQYEFERGLCMLTETSYVFELAGWMREKNYCACFNQFSMHDIRCIRARAVNSPQRIAGEHYILVASFDAESG